MEIEYSDDTILTNNFIEYIPCLYLKHNESKIASLTDHISHSEPKRDKDYSAIISFDLNATDSYTFDPNAIFELKFDYNEKPMAFEFFDLQTMYVSGGSKKLHIEVSTRVSKDIEVGDYTIDFNCYINNVTEYWKQKVNVIVDFSVTGE